MSNGQLQAARFIEYQNCKKDYNRFIYNYILIPEVGGSNQFKLYNKQEELLNLIYNEHHVCVVKTRQVGASTILQAYIVWLMLFYDNMVIGVVSRDGPECTDFARKCMDMIENLPKWLRPKFEKKTEQSFILDNGSKLYTGTVNPAKPSGIFRGKAIVFLVIDEAAYVSYIEDAYTGIAPALSKAQTVAKQKGIPYGTVIISTPNGVSGDGEWYFERVKEARAEKGIFKYFEMHWKQIPEFANDPNWYKEQCKLLGNDKRRIAQELDMVFLGSKDAVFEDETIHMLQQVTEDPKFKKHILGGDLWIFKEVKPEIRYLIGVDTATKDGRCHSSIQVLEFETLEQVAEYQGDLEITDFENLVKLTMDMYPNNLTIIEVNSYGNQMVTNLKRNIKYSNRLFKRKVKDKRGKVIDYKYGFDNNSKTRPLVIEAILTYVEDYPYIVKSKRLMSELISLEEKNGRVKGKNTDDLVMALGFCLYVVKYKMTEFVDVTNIDKDEIKAMKEIISEESDQNVYMYYKNQIRNLMRIQDKEEYNKYVQELHEYNAKILNNYLG